MGSFWIYFNFNCNCAFSLAILTLLSYREKGSNLILFKILLIILDYIVDLMFVLIHSRDINVLYYPSWFCIIAPLVFNSIVSFLLFKHELSRQNTEFYEWFISHYNIATLFTIFSWIDIDILTLMNSKLADFSWFKAPLSNSSETWILRASCINLFIEDAPQLAIQTCYIIWSVNYEIIPFTNLVTSSLLFFCIIIGKIIKYGPTISCDFVIIFK